MKANTTSRKFILSAAIASALLLPSLARAGVDITTGNYVPGNYAAAAGYGNNVPGHVCFVGGQANYVQGSYNTFFGFNGIVNAGAVGNFSAGGGNTVSGNFNSVLGLVNTSGATSVGSLIFGTGNSVAGVNSLAGGQNNISTGNQSLVFGNLITASGSGSVTISGSDTFGRRAAAPANRFITTVPDRFNAAFNGGYFLRTNDGQGSFPDAGIFVVPSGAQSLTVSQRAYVGINTTTPAFPLDIVGNISTTGLPAFTWFTQGSTAFQQSAGGSASILSIRADGGVLAYWFAATSDERIKNIQGRSDRAEDLQKLLGIEITDYLYKDVVGKGNRPHKKVIAQQVERVFPQAVSQMTDVVPDIYKKATINLDWVELATDLKVGERVRLITEDGVQAVHEVLEVSQGKFRTDFRSENKQVFVYGREVKDFRTVDYEAIAMLNVSATQELARKVEAKDAEIAKLNAKLAALEARDQAREARLARLEAAASPKAAHAIPAALKVSALAK